MVKSINKQPTDEKNERNLKILERYCFVHDGDGHDYVIPVWKKTIFDTWVTTMENDDEEHSNDSTNFNDCRIDGGLLTFTDPKVN